MKQPFDGPHRLVGCRKTRYNDECGRFLGYQRSGICSCGQELCLEQRLDPRIREAFDASDEFAEGSFHFSRHVNDTVKEALAQPTESKVARVSKVMISRLDEAPESYAEIVAPLGDGLRSLPLTTSVMSLLRDSKDSQVRASAARGHGVSRRRRVIGTHNL